MNKQRGAAQVVVLIILILGIVSGIYLVGQRTNLLPKAFYPRYSPNAEAAIQTDADLARVLYELEYTNVDLLDSSLTTSPVPGASGPASTPVATAFPSSSPEASPSPTGTCEPRPGCLDSTPRCLLPEPAEGWCPSPSPTCMIPEGCSSPSPTSSQFENSSVLDF